MEFDFTNRPHSSAMRRRAAVGIALALWLALFPAWAPAEDLKAHGVEWERIKTDWGAEEALHAERMKALEAQPDGPNKKLRVESEKARHLRESKGAAARRAKVQEAIVVEANRRAVGKADVSKGIHTTSGTDAAGPKGRGMAGDIDYGAGARTAEKVQGVLDDMGIKASVKTTASTVEIGDGLNIAINKEGALGRPGTGAHETQVRVNAGNKETYVSESMHADDVKNKSWKQAGRDYVQVQDHKKKALEGLMTDPAKLDPKSPKAQEMVKGTLKTMDHLSNDDLARVMAKNDIPGDPDSFRKRMADLKEGRAHFAPEEAGKLQRASRDVFDKAELKTRVRAEREIAVEKSSVRKLEAAGRAEEALALREELVDTRKKMDETRRANAERTARAEPDARTRVDGPDTRTRIVEPPAQTRVAEPEARSRVGSPEGAPAGMYGKAVEVVGKAMIATDILAGADDAKKAIVEGDMKKLRETAIQTIDGIAGSPLGTATLIKDRLVDGRADAERELSRTQANLDAAREQDIRVDLRRGGYTAAEVDRIMAAREFGDETRLQEAYAKLGKEMPKEEKVDRTRGGLTAWDYGAEVFDNAGEVVTSMAHRTKQAAVFAKDAVLDVAEIGAGLVAEEGVATTLYREQKDNLGRENLTEGVAHLAEKGGEFLGLRATPEERTDAAQRKLVEFYVARGADPAEAGRIAEAYFARPGDMAVFEEMKAFKEKLANPSGKGKDKEKMPSPAILPLPSDAPEPGVAGGTLALGEARRERPKREKEKAEDENSASEKEPPDGPVAVSLTLPPIVTAGRTVQAEVEIRGGKPPYSVTGDLRGQLDGSGSLPWTAPSQRCNPSIRIRVADQNGEVAGATARVSVRPPYLEGTLGGSFNTGSASGRVTLNLAGGTVNGSVSGRYDSSTTFSGSVRGTYNRETGGISCHWSGGYTWKSGKETKTGAISGTFTGVQEGTGVSGSGTASGGGETESGSWSASGGRLRDWEE